MDISTTRNGPEFDLMGILYDIGFKGFQLVLFFSFLGISTLMSYSYFYDICKLHYLVTENSFLTLTLILLGMILSFNVYFNYLMSVFVQPGGTQHLRHIAVQHAMHREGVPEIRDKNPYDSDEEDLEENLNIKGKVCLKCRSFKPLRAHHCSVCGECVLRMDHHCRMLVLFAVVSYNFEIAWICNCVGHYNHRYFILLLFYVTLSTLVYTLSALPLIFSEDYLVYSANKTSAFYTLFWLSLILFFVLLVFSAWNWFLAATGQTAIEFWGRRAQESYSKVGIKDLEEQIFDFRQEIKLKNLEYIFGTSSLIKMFLPSWRELDHEGVDWESYTKAQSHFAR